jgi:hypothetical protein
MSRELRLGALLGAVEDYRRTRCEELLGAARREAGALRREAHAAARAKVRATLAQERARLEAEVANRQARLQTERRLAEQRGVSRLLGEAWPLLRAAIAAAWAAPASRLRWASQHLALAAALLPSRRWRIRHAPGLRAEERLTLMHDLQLEGVEWAEDPSIAAGLAVQADSNVLDATLEGLLADRQALESRLLVLLEDAAR